MSLNALQLLPKECVTRINTEEHLINYAHSPIWKHIEYHFENLQEVFLHVKEYKNKHHVGINGKLVFEIDKGAGSFTNTSKAILAATKGLIVKARQIKNKGRILTRGTFEHISGHRSTLDNQGGIIYAQNGIKGINLHHHSPSLEKKGQRILQNKQGFISAGEGCLQLQYDRIDNKKGIFNCNTLKIQSSYFDNTQGKIFIIRNGHFTIYDTFCNSQGIIECGGKLLVECRRPYKILRQY